MNKIKDELKANVALGVAAHADDLDFNAAGTLARLSDEGVDVYYLILTDGCKGSADPDMDRKRLAEMRQQEQRAAASRLGVKEVFFLSYEDGALEITQHLKRDIVRYIRKLKPDVVVTFDPTMVYYAPIGFVNHPDHRACGQAVLDAVYPLARDRLTFPELADDGLQPHIVSTVLLTNYDTQNYYVDISGSLDRKCDALVMHATQFKDPSRIQRQCQAISSAMGKKCGSQHAEGFVRIDVQA